MSSGGDWIDTRFHNSNIGEYQCMQEVGMLMQIIESSLNLSAIFLSKVRSAITVQNTHTLYAKLRILARTESFLKLSDFQ